MHLLGSDKKKQTANFNIHDSNEQGTLLSAANLLIERQKKYVNKLGAVGFAPQIEIDRLKRYETLPDYIKLGITRMPKNIIMDLEDAMNAALVKYEREVTDNPNDSRHKEYKRYIKLLHQTGRRELKTSTRQPKLISHKIG